MSSPYPAKSKSKVRKSALAGSAEYQPFEVLSLGGGLDQQIRRSLTDPGKWWDGTCAYAERLRAIKAAQYSPFVQRTLAPPFQGIFERGCCFYVGGTTLRWDPNGHVYEDLLIATSASIPADFGEVQDWEVKLEGDPESFWTGVASIADWPSGGQPFRTLTLDAPYQVGYGDPAATTSAAQPIRRKLLFRRADVNRRESCPANLIGRFYETALTDHLLLGTCRMVYKRNPSTGDCDYADCINPIHNAGGVFNFTSGRLVVNFSGGLLTSTTWPLPAGQSWLFKMDGDPDTYWTRVDSIGGTNTLTLKNVYPGATASGAYTMLKIWQAGVPDQQARLNQWSWTNWLYDVPGRRWVLTNGVDRPMLWHPGLASGKLFALAWKILDTDGITKIDWPTPPTWARHVIEFKEHLVFAHYLRSGTIYERGIFWSAPLDCELYHDSWFRNLSGPGEIVGISKLSDNLIVFMDTSIRVMRYLGAPFYFGMIDRIEDVGCVAGGSIQAIQDQQIIFLGEDDVYSYDGVRARKVGASVRELIFNTLNDLNKPLIASRFDEVTNRYYLSVPTTESNFRNHRTFSFDVQQNTWASPFDGPTAFGRYEVQATRFVNDDFRIVNTVYELVDSRYTERTPLLLGGDYGGHIYLLNTGTSRDSAAAKFSFETGITDLGVSGLKRIGWVEIDGGKAIYPGQFSVGYSRNGEDLFWGQPITMEIEGALEGEILRRRNQRLWVNRSGYFFAFRFEHERADDDIQIDKICVYFRWRGPR